MVSPNLRNLEPTFKSKSFAQKTCHFKKMFSNLANVIRMSALLSELHASWSNRETKDQGKT